MAPREKKSCGVCGVYVASSDCQTCGLPLCCDCEYSQAGVGHQEAEHKNERLEAERRFRRGYWED